MSASCSMKPRSPQRSRWFELAERHLIPNGLRVATGTNAYFAELNRQRPPRGAVACYSINPQVHTFDDLSLVETLEAQPATVESALQFCDRDLIVSPITLRPRFNPNATDPAKQREDPSSQPILAKARYSAQRGQLAAWRGCSRSIASRASPFMKLPVLAA